MNGGGSTHTAMAQQKQREGSSSAFHLLALFKDLVEDMKAYVKYAFFHLSKKV